MTPFISGSAECPNAAKCGGEGSANLLLPSRGARTCRVTLRDQSRVPAALRKAIFSQLSGLAGAMCAPVWWSIKRPADERATILHNGTICYVNTGVRELGITANHVYEKYLQDAAGHGEEAVECQFGGSTIYPDKHGLDQSRVWDLATFEIPIVFVTASKLRGKSQHFPVTWPPSRVVPGELVLYGGYPGVLREEKGDTADLPFQWVCGRVNDVGQHNIVLEPAFDTGEWFGDDRNSEPGGMSGGPVFRLVDGLIARMELVGFIHEFPYEDAILARHADAVDADGMIRTP